MTAALPIWAFRLPGVHRLAGRPPVVGVLRLYGPVGCTLPGMPGLTLSALEPEIDRLFGLPGLAGIALAVNSTGGSPVQANMIMERLRTGADAAGVPILAFCEDFAASGGYWICLAADRIYAAPNALVGSIGAIVSSFGLDGAMARMGIERRIYKSGARKQLIDPFRPEAPEDRAKLEEMLSQIHADFIAVVRARRGARLSGDPERLFTGELWRGAEAVELGLVDSTLEMRAALAAEFGPRTLLFERRRLVPLRRR